MASGQWLVARKRDPRAERPSTPIGPQTPWTRPLCHFGPHHILTFRHAFAQPHAKSNYSRTSTKYTRKSNHSRTYAKTGGWGLYPFACRSPFLCVPCVLCGGPDPLFLLATRHQPLATNSDHSRTIGNCCPTSRTRFHSYHYITYPCRRADNFAFPRDGGQT